jgi:hypothetical protein
MSKLFADVPVLGLMNTTNPGGLRRGVVLKMPVGELGFGNANSRIVLRQSGINRGLFFLARNGLLCGQWLHQNANVNR